MSVNLILKGLSDVEKCGTKVMTELKSGSREKSILSSVIKSIRHFQDGTGGQKREGQPAIEGQGSTPLKEEVSPTGFIYNDECISQLGYACQVLFKGEGNQGLFFSKGSSKLTALTLEFCAVVLSSGVLPNDLVGARPSYTFSKSGETNFLSKLLTSSREAKAVPSGSATTSAEKENVRLSVVECLLSVCDIISQKDANDRAVLLYMSAVSAAVIPTLSRLTCEREATVFHDTPALHSTALVKCLSILFHFFSRTTSVYSVSSEIKRIILNVARSVTKNIDHGRLGPEPSPSCTVVTDDPGTSNGSTPRAKGGERDVVEVLNFCCSIVMQAPLLSSSDVPLPSDAHSFLNAYEAAVKDVMNVASASYPTLVSCFQVILYIIVNGGPPLRNSLTVLECIRTSVIPTCIKSSVSDDFDVFKLSLNILLVCCNRFGEMLLNETYTVFRHVYFRVLESKITSQDQKALVIDSLRKFIEEPQNLIGLFLNYDCNTHSASIYEEMIHYLGSIARPPQLKSLGRLNLDLDSVVSKRMECSFGVELRRKAVLTLLLIAESNIQWIERFDLGSSDVLSELNTAAHLLEEDAAETGNDTNEVNHTEGTSVVNQTEMIIHARRYKDAFKKFTTLFNTKNTPKAAVEYFIGCPILHASSTNESKNDEPSEEAPKSPTADSTGTQVKNQDGASCEAVEVASFLKENEDYLDKMALGEYFAKSFSNTTSRLVFQEWINLHDFKDMTLDEALRLFLGGFKLLGEAQVVDRTMELFAAHYCSQNPSVFTQADTAFILSFSICMLNTDAHSPHVKNKMTLEGFIKNNRGIDEGKDVDPNVLKGIYERITQNEIVLRPSPKCSNQTQSNSLTDKGSEKKKTRAGILESIPILKHLSPIATAITDKVLLPMDSANIFGISQKRRQELYQDELKEALREVMGALASQGSVTAPDMFQTATSIENALPMWEISVDLVANLYLAAVCEFMEAAESYDTSSVLPNTTPNAVDSTDCYLKINDNQEYFDALMMGLTNIIRVCCSFGNSMQTELLLESSYELTNISQVVSVSNPQKPVVTVVGPLSMVRIELLSRYVDLYAAFGSFFSSRMWQAAYSSVSFLDVLANGIDGLWRRQDKHLLFSKQNANTVKADPSLYTDMFFGNLTLVPPSIENNSWKNRYQILSSIRVARSKTQSVDYWVEKLFDATCYPSSAQLQMSNALSLVCGRELQHGRTFSLTKLFDFVTICAPISTRLQWRDLWMNVMPVFISAGNMKASVCNPTLDGLRLIALSYLTREELVNYSFQKEVLRPFGEIFMANSSAGARKKIIDIVAELVDLRAAYLASGWHVVFSCLSRAAGFPEVVEQAWSVCLHIVKRHIEHVKEYFNDLVFCFASFAGCEVEEIALCSLSFSVACGHWLQYGLDPVPSDVTTPQDVLRWATRMKSADIELSTMAHLDKKYPRVSLAQEPLSGTNLLQPPSDFTTKTVYQLWLSLFECMVPVIVTHKMVRVRAHAISAMLNLLSFYGCLFEEEVQASIVLGVLKRLATTLIKETPTEDTKEEYDRTDYKLLVLLMTKGMFTASNDCPSMARLTSTALRSIIENIKFTNAAIENDLVDVLVRVCEDILMCFEMAAVRPSGSGSTPDPPADPLIAGLMNENRQIGSVDIFNYKKTASWVELHESVIFSNLRPVFGRLITSHDGVKQQLFDDVFVGFNVLLRELKDSFLKNSENREFCLFLFHCTRHVLLGIANYLLTSENTESLSVLYSMVEPAEDEGVELLPLLPAEYLLLSPFTWVLIDFSVREFQNKATYPALQEQLNAKCHTFTKLLSLSRQYCLQQTAQAAPPSAESDPKETPQRRSFADIFPVCKDSLPDRKSETPENGRIHFCQWLYLMQILSVRCLFTFPEGGVGTFFRSERFLFDALSNFPSQIEETMAKEFFWSCWNELGLHCNMTEECTFELCLGLLRNKITVV